MELLPAARVDHTLLALQQQYEPKTCSSAAVPVRRDPCLQQGPAHLRSETDIMIDITVNVIIHEGLISLDAVTGHQIKGHMQNLFNTLGAQQVATATDARCCVVRAGSGCPFLLQQFELSRKYMHA